MSGHPVSDETIKAAGKIVTVAILALMASLLPELKQQFSGTPLDISTSNATQTEQFLGDSQTYYKVTKVVDGDTLHIMINGIDEKVRLIGINTPETVDPRRPVQCFGKEASARMKDLAQGKLVRVQTDDSQGARDSYGRLLAYVYLEDGQMLNRKMVAEGYAYEYTYLTPYMYQKEFKGLQNLARTSKYGLWSDTTCKGTK
jgi:micrococcal nuclease